MPEIFRTACTLNFITNRLAIGDIRARYLPGWSAIVTCCSPEQIREAGFDPALPRSAGPVLKIPFPDGVLPDNPEGMLRTSRLFIGEALYRGGCALVHCGAGISRSPFVVLDYLMSVLGMTTTEALAFVRRSHPGASPAEVYLRFLSKLHRDEERANAGPLAGLVAGGGS